MPSLPPTRPPRRRLSQYLLLAVLVGLGLIVSHEVSRSLRLTRLHDMGARFSRWEGPFGSTLSFALCRPCLVEPRRASLGLRQTEQENRSSLQDPRLPEFLRQCILLQNVAVSAEWAQHLDVAEAILGLPDLETLQVRGPEVQLGTGAWSKLDRMRKLKELSIYEGVTLAKPAWEKLSTLPRLEEMEVENLTDADMVHVSRLPHLRRLVVLRSPQFTAASLLHLQKIATLTSLQLTQTGVSESDAAAFKLALAKVDVQWAAEESGI